MDPAEQRQIARKGGKASHGGRNGGREDDMDNQGNGHRAQRDADDEESQGQRAGDDRYEDDEEENDEESSGTEAAALQDSMPRPGGKATRIGSD